MCDSPCCPRPSSQETHILPGLQGPGCAKPHGVAVLLTSPFSDGEMEAWGRGIHLLKIQADKAEPGCALTSVRPPRPDVSSRVLLCSRASVSPLCLHVVLSSPAVGRQGSPRVSEQQPQAWPLPEEPGWDSSQVDRNQIAGNRRGHHGGLSMRLSFPICERKISLCAWALPSVIPGMRSELLSLAFAALTCRGSTPITSRQGYLVPSFCSAVPRTSRVVSCAHPGFLLAISSFWTTLPCGSHAQTPTQASEPN